MTQSNVELAEWASGRMMSFRAVAHGFELFSSLDFETCFHYTAID